MNWRNGNSYRSSENGRPDAYAASRSTLDPYPPEGWVNLKKQGPSYTWISSQSKQAFRPGPFPGPTSGERNFMWSFGPQKSPQKSTMRAYYEGLNGKGPMQITNNTTKETGRYVLSRADPTGGLNRRGIDKFHVSTHFRFQLPCLVCIGEGVLQNQHKLPQNPIHRPLIHFK